MITIQRSSRVPRFFKQSTDVCMHTWTRKEEVEKEKEKGANVEGLEGMNANQAP